MRDVKKTFLSFSLINVFYDWDGWGTYQEVRDSEGLTAMLRAIRAGDSTRNLFDTGCNVLATDSKGFNALHYAVLLGPRHYIHFRLLEDDCILPQYLLALLKQREHEKGLRPEEFAEERGIKEVADRLRAVREELEKSSKSCNNISA